MFLSINNYFGIFWGKNAFWIAETTTGKELNSITIPFDTPLDSDQNSDIPEALRYTALIQKALIEKEITSKMVCLSLPMEDLIFRSFVIPVMQPEEVRSVVDFEVTKYIPIKLEELSYTYHPINFTENGQKNIRILFVAIRKDILKRYTNILENSGLQVCHIEPYAVSLTRVLQKHKYLSHYGSCALLEFEESEGKIIIVEHGVVQFIRKFQIPEVQTDQDIRDAQLFNDIRVSFNFYSRQNPQAKINKIITISSKALPGLSDNLSAEFGLNAISITTEDILKDKKGCSLDILNAYGSALHDTKDSSKNFNLSERAIKSKISTQNYFAYLRKYKKTVWVAIGCLIFILLVKAGSKKMSESYKTQLKQLEEKQGKFASVSLEEIKELRSRFTSKLDAYRSIRTSSDISSYLIYIPQALPDGIWLNNLNIKYVELKPDERQKSADKNQADINRISRDINQIKKKEKVDNRSKMTLTFSGLIYHPKPNEQFRIVNNLVSWFENKEHFGDSFKKITLLNSSPGTFDEYEVMSFTLNFE